MARPKKTAPVEEGAPAPQHIVKDTGTAICTTPEQAETVRKVREAQAAEGEGFTPAPGSKRAEERARSQAALDAVRERIAATGMFSVDVRELLGNRELMRGLEGQTLEVTNPDPNYEYHWATIETVSAAKRRKYEFVVGAAEQNRENAENYRPGYHDDPSCDEEELRERCRELGQRRINEMILMRCRIDDAYLNRLKDAADRLHQQYGVDEKFLAAADEAGFRVLPLNTGDMNVIRQKKGYGPRLAVPNAPIPPAVIRGVREGTLGGGR